MHEAVKALKTLGVTAVDPGLEARAAQPLHLPGASRARPTPVLPSSQRQPVTRSASPLSARSPGRPRANSSSAGSDGSGQVDPERVGRLNPYIVDALERYDRGEGPAEKEDSGDRRG
jgi:hypothetical protein